MTIVINVTHGFDDVMFLISALPLQVGPRLSSCLALVILESGEVVANGHDLVPVWSSQHVVSLSLSHERENWQREDDPPQVALRLPDTLPRLRELYFGSYDSWDMFHEALWPVAVLAARTAAEHTANGDAISACDDGSALLGLDNHFTA